MQSLPQHLATVAVTPPDAPPRLRCRKCSQSARATATRQDAVDAPANNHDQTTSPRPRPRGLTGEALQAPSTGRLIHRHLETSATSQVQTPRVDLSKHVQPTAAEISAAFAETLVKQHETRLKTDKKHARTTSSRRSCHTAEVQALLDETRQAFQESLAKTHEAKLEMQKQHAAQLNALQSELRETQKAFGESLVKSHEQKINLINQHSVELRQADARARRPCGRRCRRSVTAFTDYMARKQNELMERTTASRKMLMRRKPRPRRSRVNSIRSRPSTSTRNKQTTLIEAQGTSCRKARVARSRRGFCHCMLLEKYRIKRALHYSNFVSGDLSAFRVNPRIGVLASMADAAATDGANDAQPL